MCQKDPSPQTTLVILLGASQWPEFSEFTSSNAFANSANQLKAYLLNSYQFNLPSENLLDLFDVDKSADDIDRTMCNFLDQRITKMKISGNSARDLLVYYVGHGGFVGPQFDYYLAIRRTRSNNPRASSIGIASLADTLKENARHLRRFVILDCCFAAAAFRYFESGPGQAAIQQAVDVFKEKGEGFGYPERGTALLCSSGSKVPSLISRDGSQTLFTAALLRALTARNPRQQYKSYLSLRELTTITVDLLAASPEKNAPRPYLHSPDQSEGDIADIPFFPNLISFPSPYKKEWTSQHPGYIIVLLDQSSRMAHSFGSSHEKMCDMVATVLNNFLSELITVNTIPRSDGTSEVKPRVEVTVLGYGNGEVSSLLFHTPAKKDNLTLPELTAHPLDIQIRQMKDFDDTGREHTIQVPFPVWIHPKAVGNAPICMALWKAKGFAEQWAAYHPECYPPIVIHITRGVADDGDPLTQILQLCQVRTADGQALLYNTVITSLLDRAISYPSSEEDLPNDRSVRKLFTMSSLLPKSGLHRLQSSLGISNPEGARGFIFNGDCISMGFTFPFPIHDVLWYP
jgi:Caspase domain